MPKSKKHIHYVVRKHMRGQGFLDDAWEGVKKGASKVGDAVQWLKDKRLVSTAINLPYVGTALRNLPYAGKALEVAASLGLGKCGVHHRSHNARMKCSKCNPKK